MTKCRMSLHATNENSKTVVFFLLKKKFRSHLPTYTIHMSHSTMSDFSPVLLIGSKTAQPRRDLNPRSPAPEADALSIRPLGLLYILKSGSIFATLGPLRKLKSSPPTDEGSFRQACGALIPKIGRSDFQRLAEVEGVLFH